MHDVMTLLAPDMRGWGSPPAGGEPPAPIFIGGAARSGTTLLRAILDAHSRIACGQELKIGKLVLDQWQEVRRMQNRIRDAQTVEPDEVDRLYRQLFLGLLEPYRLATGKARIAEKSPVNAFLFQALGALFPQAVFVHIIRDGRDVVASLLRQTHWRDAQGEALAITTQPAEAARYWVAAVEAGRAAGKGLGSRYIELRYEDLVCEPAAVLECLMEWLGERFEPAMLTAFQDRVGADEPNAAEVARPIHRESVGAWRRALTPDRFALVEEAAGPLLAKLGYTA